MSDKNRNRSSSNSSDENWNNRQEGRYDQQQHNQYGQAQYGDVNYNRDDRDRNRNYSGSNYGNYSGSNYGYTGSNQGNYDQDYGSDYNRQNYGSQDQWSQTSNYDRYRQRGRDESGSDYDRNYGGGYGSSANYGSGYSGSNYGNFDRSRNTYNDEYNRNRNRDYSGGNYNAQNRGNWGNRQEDRDWWDKTRDEVSSWFGDTDAERRRRMDRNVSGAHKGKGPRDYKRSDERILEDVCDRLSDDSFVDASDIDVKVSGSEVVLTGSVESREAKRRAEDLAERISGVTNVQNNLKVKNTNDSSGLRSTYDPGRYRE